MKRSIFVLLAFVTAGCTGDAETAGPTDLVQQYSAIVTQSCVEGSKLGPSPGQGGWGSSAEQGGVEPSPEWLIRNCRCVADSMARFVPPDLQAQAVKTGTFEDSDWASIGGTPAESKIAEALYQDCAMSYALAYALFRQWP
jgi:hypothetical protein